jgi:hypothetical protein
MATALAASAGEMSKDMAARAGSLTLRLGNFERTTSAHPEFGVQRSVEIGTCVCVLNYTGAECDIGFVDVREQQESLQSQDPIVGTLKFETTEGVIKRSIAHVGLTLPTAAFNQIWNATEATDGAIRSLQIEAEEQERDYLPSVWYVTKVALIESMGDARNFDLKTHRDLPIPPRQHPVVVEIRALCASIASTLQRLVILLIFFLAVAAVVWGIEYLLERH